MVSVINGLRNRKFSLKIMNLLQPHKNIFDNKKRKQNLLTSSSSHNVFESIRSDSFTFSILIKLMQKIIGFYYNIKITKS